MMFGLDITVSGRWASHTLTSLFSVTGSSATSILLESEVKVPSIDGKVCHVPWSSPRPELLPHSVITHPSNLCAKFSEISLASSISMPTFEAPSVACGIPEGEPE